MRDHSIETYIILWCIIITDDNTYRYEKRSAEPALQHIKLFNSMHARKAVRVNNYVPKSIMSMLPLAWGERNTNSLITKCEADTHSKAYLHQILSSIRQKHVKFLQKESSCRQKVLTDRKSLQSKSPYRQKVLTDRKSLQSESFCRNKVLTGSNASLFI